MADFNTLRNDQVYRDTRYALGLQVEKYRPQIYLDTVGVPTVGVGLALISNQVGGWTVRWDRIALLEQETGTAFADAEKAKLQDIAGVLNNSKDPIYAGAKTTDAFLATDRGQRMAEVVGFEVGLDGKYKWAVSDFSNFSVNPTQAKNIFNSMMDTEYESRVDRLLRNGDIDPSSIGMNERAGYALMVYQNWTIKISEVANLIKSGASEMQIYERIKTLSGGYSTRALDEYRTIMGDPNAGVTYGKDGSFIFGKGDKSGGIVIRPDGTRIEFDQNGNDTATGLPALDPAQLNKLYRQMRMRSELDTGTDIAMLADAFAEEAIHKSSTNLADGSTPTDATTGAAWAAAEARKKLVDAWETVLDGQDLNGAEVVVTDKGSALVLQDGRWIEVSDTDAVVNITTISIAQPSNGSDTFANFIQSGTLIDALSLIKAIQSIKGVSFEYFLEQPCHVAHALN